MIFDTFTFFNELDLLEIRLNVLDPYVDYFVLVESVETFSGKPKPLYYQDNKKRFEKWNHKIIHKIVGSIKAESAFGRAFYQKESVRDVLNEYAKPDDIVYFGDLDEIWKPKKIKDNKVYNLEQLNYCYYLNNRSSERWVGTIVGKWKEISKNTLSYWRATHTNELAYGGWHFTNMGGIEQIKKKLDAYDHQEYNNSSTIDGLGDRIKYGEDYVGRQSDWQGKPFSFELDEGQLPEYIISNKSKLHDYFKS